MCIVYTRTNRERQKLKVCSRFAISKNKFISTTVQMNIVACYAYKGHISYWKNMDSENTVFSSQNKLKQVKDIFLEFESVVNEINVSTENPSTTFESIL